MINVHLNGDLVRCPDIRAAQLRAREARDIHRICQYNIHEDTCQAWQQSLINWQAVKKNSDCGRCMLSGSDLCPGHRARIAQGKKEKQFQINNVTYRKMSSAAHDLIMSSRYKTIFLTLTFPKFLKQHKLTKSFYYEYAVNKAFSKFVENLRTNYNCAGYIAVRERGTIGNRLHFHLLCAMPYNNFVALNRAWNSAISDLCVFSASALRTTKNSLFIKEPGRALRYVCKYFAKSKRQLSASRLVFMSNNLIKKPVTLRGASIESILQGYKEIYINQTSDYSTCFRITNSNEFDKFCKEFLYPTFENEFNYPLFFNKKTVLCSPGSG